MRMPVTRIPTVDFAFKNSKGVNIAATLTGLIRNIPAYWRGVRTLKAVVEETRPDVIINFFEPLTGLYAFLHRKRPPVVAIAHQFMTGHPDYIRVPDMRLQQWVMKCFVALVGSASTRLALSFYEAKDLPDKKTTVCPPILRRQIFELHSNPDGKFVLAYLLNHGYAEQIIQWHRSNPETVLHCFYDKPDAPAEFRYDETLTFHRLDGEKFLRMMADCKYVACTAGFESVSEAAYLGKPLFLMPVENHVEQKINALDATAIGLGIHDTSFKLDRLRELPDRLENTRFRDWLHRADKILIRTLEDTVRQCGGAKKATPPLQEGVAKTA